jgi:dishevelled associated activator of morphogenesis
VNELKKKLEEKEKLCQALSQTTAKLRASLDEEMQKREAYRKEVSQLKEKLKEIDSNSLKSFVKDSDHRSKNEKYARRSLILNSSSTLLSQSSSVASQTPQIEAQPSPAPPPPPPPAPPLPAASNDPPSPPPLPLNGFGEMQTSQLIKNKNIPKSKIPMKCFNWTKLNQANLDDTVWKNVNENHLYKLINLDEFQQIFSAYQNDNGGNYSNLALLGNAGNDTNTIKVSSGLMVDSQTNVHNSLRLSYSKTINRLNFNNSKIKKEFSVIESRRARNCTIFLSSLKLTNEELNDIIVKMDPKELLQRDTIEQLLKFVPTQEEAVKLEESRSELNSMAKADRFLYDMSKVFRYKEKLESLYYMKKYAERYKELSIKIEATIKCCSSLVENKNVLKLLEIVLCLGNYMNQAHRNGIASGFCIANLNNLINIKSSTDKTYSMLHFLVNTIENKVNFLFFYLS